MRGGGVRARAHACVALGRCVAFGRPKMSVWGHAGARSRTPKVACISFLRALFGHEFDVSVSFFPFWTPSASPVCSVPLRSPHGPTHAMEALDCPPDAVRRSRSRSPDATSHELPTTPAVVVAGCDETAITPTIDPHLDASCSACMAASRWIPHTCKKARGVNKRHATPAADGRRTKRSSVTAALGFRAPHHSETSVDVDSLSMTRSSMHDSSFRIVEGRDVPSHPSSSEAPPAPIRPPSPVLTPTLEQGEASEVDGLR